MSRRDLRETLQDRPVVLDGGLATLLERHGHDLSSHLWSARLLRDEPAAIEAAHREFFRAGAEVATTASYQVSFEGFGAEGVDRAEVERLLRRSVALAAAARDEAAPGGWVAASVGPYGAVLADGSEYRGDYDLDVAGLRAFHRPRLDVLASTVGDGADVLAIETVPCLAEVEAVLAELDGTGVPAWLSLSAADGRTRAGEPLEEAYAMAADVAEVLAVGVNCTTPRTPGPPSWSPAPTSPQSSTPTPASPGTPRRAPGRVGPPSTPRTCRNGWRPGRDWSEGAAAWARRTSRRCGPRSAREAQPVRTTSRWVARVIAT